MVRTVLARFDGEVLRPQEPLDLDTDACYRLTIEDARDTDADADAAPAAGVFDDLLALAEDLDLPLDLSSQIDHYLYGTPKR